MFAKLALAALLVVPAMAFAQNEAPAAPAEGTMAPPTASETTTTTKETTTKKKKHSGAHAGHKKGHKKEAGTPAE